MGKRMQHGAPSSGRFLWPAAAALFIGLFLSSLSFVAAHPVPRRAHDRTIAVRLGADEKSSQPIVTVAYRLEVDEFTVVFEDLPALGDKAELTKFRSREDFYDAFTRLYAPILAANLIVKLDGQTLAFTCVRRSHTLTDENGVALNHLRCDFSFQAKPGPTRFLPHGLPAPFLVVDLALADFHALWFREGNYELEEGLIRSSVTGDESVTFLSKTEPDTALQARPLAEAKPGDDAQLRTLLATFLIRMSGPSAATASAESPRGTLTPPEESAQQALQPRPWWTRLQELSLRDLFLETKYGFWMLMALSLAVGGVHALTPGHGKTLVAAYLVGERGTVGHALILGLVTTLTHTGVVIGVAAALRLFVPDGRLTPAGQQNLQTVLEFGGGLLVVCLGFWLLLRRLTGQADHFHLPGHGHHYHDEHGHVHPLPQEQPSVRWWGLVVLGINGGIVPCWDAIVVLVLAVSTNRLWLALPMLLAFSAGLAGVLVLVGIAVVRAKRLADPRWRGSRVSKLLPIASSLVVTLLGLWLCFDSLHVKPAPPADVVHVR